jgi:hypothetical protein
MFSTPILLVSFNRPDSTLEVLKIIKKVKPSKLYFAVDGPRSGNDKDKINCTKNQQLIKFVDWKCDVKTLFQKNNLGCGLGVVTAINWFFGNVKEGIILEDDCLPNLDFFRFCSELLKYYRHNGRIMHISGDNFQYGIKRGRYSYYFSQYPHIWGWATWRRAWKYNDYYCIPKLERKNRWGMQWEMSVKKNNGVAILPNVNLVCNIGFGKNATHTFDRKAKYAFLQAEKMEFPLIHPDKVVSNIKADLFTNRNHFNGTTLGMLRKTILGFVPVSLKNIIKRIIKKTIVLCARC